MSTAPAIAGDPPTLPLTLPDFLSADEDGYVHCTDHRIGLVDIVYLFNEGYSPEMIVGQFPTLPLSLVYKVVAFYLEHRDDVDTYVNGEFEEMARQRHAAPHGPGLAELRQRLARMQPARAS